MLHVSLIYLFVYPARVQGALSSDCHFRLSQWACSFFPPAERGSGVPIGPDVFAVDKGQILQPGLVTRVFNPSTHSGGSTTEAKAGRTL